MTAINQTEPSHIQRLPNASYDVAVIGGGDRRRRDRARAGRLSAIGRADRSSRRCRRRHQQGQHGPAAHRLRRDARDAREPARPSRLRTPQRVCHPHRNPGRAHRRAAGRLEPGRTRRAPGLKDKASANGYDRCQIIDAVEVYRAAAAPRNAGALGAPHRPRRVDHLHLDRVPGARDRRPAARAPNCSSTIASTESRQAANTPCCTRPEARSGPDTWSMPRAWGQTTIDGLFGHERFTVTPRRGELLVFDKLARPLVNRIVLAVPTKLGKGVLISPTIYGNVMLGPTAENLTDKTATATSEAAWSSCSARARRSCPAS